MATTLDQTTVESDASMVLASAVDSTRVATSTADAEERARAEASAHTDGPPRAHTILRAMVLLLAGGAAILGLRASWVWWQGRAVWPASMRFPFAAAFLLGMVAVVLALYAPRLVAWSDRLWARWTGRAATPRRWEVTLVLGGAAALAVQSVALFHILMEMTR